MATTMKGLLKGLRYISQIFDEEKDQQMQIGFPTDVKHVAHIGSDGPAADTPSWMSDFKPQESENGQVVPRGDVNNNQKDRVGLQELLPEPGSNEKPKHKTRSKSGTISANGSPTRRSESLSDVPPKHSRRHRTRHGSMDSSNDRDPSVRRRRSGVLATDLEGSINSRSESSSGHPRKNSSRHRKPKGAGGGGEHSVKKTKGKGENSNVQSGETCNNNICEKE